MGELPSLIEQAEKTADEEKSKELKSALAQKEHFREKFEKSEADKKALEEKLNGKVDAPADSVNALDLIKLGKKLEGYSDDEIDFATTHAHSQKPEDILKTLEDPMVKLAIQGKRDQEAKEKALKPSGTQSDDGQPKSLDEILSTGSLADKEKILIEKGLYIPPKGKPDRTNIGSQR